MELIVIEKNFVYKIHSIPVTFCRDLYFVRFSIIKINELIDNRMKVK
jgi:hypothetical protein